MNLSQFFGDRVYINGAAVRRKTVSRLWPWLSRRHIVLKLVFTFCLALSKPVASLVYIPNPPVGKQRKNTVEAIHFIFQSAFVKTKLQRLSFGANLLLR